MKKLTLAILLIFSCATAWAADFDKGLAAAKAGDYATALAELKPLALQGHVKAQFNLGLMYQVGHGVPKDSREALKWYKFAGEQGDLGALCNMGTMFRSGEGVKKR